MKDHLKDPIYPLLLLFFFVLCALAFALDRKHDHAAMEAAAKCDDLRVAHDELGASCTELGVQCVGLMRDVYAEKLEMCR